MKPDVDHYMGILKASAANRGRSNSIDLSLKHLELLTRMWITGSPGVHSYVWLYQHGHEKLRDQILWAKICHGMVRI